MFVFSLPTHAHRQLTQPCFSAPPAHMLHPHIPCALSASLIRSLSLLIMKFRPSVINRMRMLPFWLCLTGRRRTPIFFTSIFSSFMPARSFRLLSPTHSSSLSRESQAHGVLHVLVEPVSMFLFYHQCLFSVFNICPSSLQHTWLMFRRYSRHTNPCSCVCLAKQVVLCPCFLAVIHTSLTPLLLSSFPCCSFSRFTLVCVCLPSKKRLLTFDLTHPIIYLFFLSFRFFSLELAKTHLNSSFLLVSHLPTVRFVIMSLLSFPFSSLPSLSLFLLAVCGLHVIRCSHHHRSSTGDPTTTCHWSTRCTNHCNATSNGSCSFSNFSTHSHGGWSTR